jgi:methylenetetrahydrofolate dehydrogenase (NADP+) / methenyltetrahydrofolate cyclohydrolase
MAATLLYGHPAADQIINRLEDQVQALDEKPGLAAVLVGDDPASQIYLRNKKEACRKIGCHFENIILPDTATPEELLTAIDRLNNNPAIHGILCQFPLPPVLSHLKNQVISRIDPHKDVDGLHPVNVGRLSTNPKKALNHGLVPATAKGILELLRFYQLDPAGKHAVIVGRSNLVGKPTAQLLLAANATVTQAHSRTSDLQKLVRLADLLVVATGQPRLIPGDWIKPGAVVIDVGINRTASGLVGDTDFASAQDRAGYITPVPGGVGPMTIAMLMANLITAYQNSLRS